MPDLAKNGLLELAEPAAVRSKRLSRQQRNKLVLEGCIQLRRCLCILVFNGMNSQWNFNYGDTKKLAETQRAAMEDINR